MSRTISALFDTRADAEAGKARLEQASIDAGTVSLIDQATAGITKTGAYSTAENPGFWSTLKGPMLPDDERHHYEEGIRRGGVLLTATVSDHDTDAAVAALENGNAVDLDSRAKDWRASGWDYAAPVGAAGAMAAKPAAKLAGDTGEEHIPIVEETLRVGKREVNRGGVRVHSHIVETPVSEQVSLREEKVSIDRRPVTGGAVPADAFKERTIEMTATSEEAVVGKTARIVEEVVVHKNVESRTETVKDTVRRTEVEVDRDVDTAVVAAGAGTTATARPGVPLGDKAAGLAKEGIGSVKQELGKLTGSETLKQEGATEEQAGEAQKGKMLR